MKTLWSDYMIQGALVLCEKNQKFLFEALPDYFPQGRLTEVELRLWDKYYRQKG